VRRAKPLFFHALLGVRRAVETKISEFSRAFKDPDGIFSKTKIIDDTRILQEAPAMNRDDSEVQLTNIIQITQLGLP